MTARPSTRPSDAARNVKVEGGENDLLERLKGDPAFASVDIDAELEPARFIGRAPQQVDEFLAAHVQPILDAHTGAAGVEDEVNV